MAGFQGRKAPDKRNWDIPIRCLLRQCHLFLPQFLFTLILNIMLFDLIHHTRKVMNGKVRFTQGFVKSFMQIISQSAAFR